MKSISRLIFSLVLMTFLVAVSLAAAPQTPWAVTPNPDLPNVLILGDSISIGYTLKVRALLDGRANVYRPHTPDGTRPVNCQGSTLGLQQLDQWLGSRHWDVIHFNWGLHDLKHVKVAGASQNSNAFSDPRQADPAAYRKNMTQLVARLKATGARLIFATTTPYPPGVTPARLPSDAILYNNIALRIMEKNRIPVNDLFSLVKDRLPQLQRPRNVHFSPEGYDVLASQVADSILSVLNQPRTPRPDSPAAAPRPARPNVVLLLTDDLGWQDVKCYDIDDVSPYETPRLDALSKQGTLFRQAYSPAPTCSPSRCAIMSGNHPARAQKTHVLGGAPPTPYNKEIFRMMPPWYSGRMPAGELTVARVLQQNGYTTGHCGKWHMAINHHAFPQPTDQGFDFSRSNRGVATRMTPHRLTGFATDQPDDPYRLDANGYPFHQNLQDALEFVQSSKNNPFFLYWATFLVHAPIQTRTEAHLKKYADRMGVDPRHPLGKDTPGQINPFYGAMVQELDYYVGRFLDYLDQTEDPRWPGHALSENTYLIFTSDNGGMEGTSHERYTENAPLDKGKISAKEGGVRVPLIIRGPGIAAGLKSDVMVNGLDFYPTLLTLTGIPRPAGKNLDGCDLSALLKQNPADPSLIQRPDGTIRDTLVWHFPHSVALHSTIRIGDYKLIHNYDYVNNPDTPPLELYRLFRTQNDKPVRVDIEEAHNLADKLPDKARQMDQRLLEILTEMKASYPYYNPACKYDLPGKDKVPTVLSHEQSGNTVVFHYRQNGAKVVRANLIYTLNGGQRYEEWFRQPASLLPGQKISAVLPAGTTHYVIDLIDENNFLVSYPEVIDVVTLNKEKWKYSKTALTVK